MPTATPRTKSSKPAKVAYLHRDPDGTITALSSNRRDVYVLRNDRAGNWTCSCPAGSAARACYHRAAAMVRFPGFFSRPFTVIVPTDPDPEPPPPAAAARRACACLLYGPDPCCRVCRPAVAA